VLASQYFLINQVSSQEAQAIVNAFKDAGGIRAGGLMVAGIKHIALRADDRSIYGKKVS
jgi:profilin